MRLAASLSALAVVLASVLPRAAAAQADRTRGPGGGDPTVPDAAQLARQEESALAPLVERYATDRRAVPRRYDADYSPERRARLRSFLETWRAELANVAFQELGRESQIDHVLLDNELRYELALLDREEREWREMAALLPFAPELITLQEERRAMAPVAPRETARLLTDVAVRVDSLREELERLPRDGTAAERLGTTQVIAFRTAGTVEGLRRMLDRWHGYYAGYDPLYTWWVREPHGRADEALQAYGRAIRERVVGIRQGEPEPIIADPIGAAGLAADLEHEMIPYTPQELVAIAEREFAWLDERMLEASHELGYGKDWHAALEHVKNLYVEPGDQPELIREMALEAAEFVKTRDLLTVPPLAEEIWRMEMMTPEAQLTSPFFLGGEVIRVSYPTDAMAHEDKLMSLRGNNPHFSRAVVHHELIPGHHLQGFMNDRYATHRGLFSTPFWTEGWALYWEMRLWDMDFPRGPEDRIGMLFWRMHRAARIMFSLNVHLGNWTPQEAIDFLVERVGHERANAEAEVRRSFNGSYPPLYQAAYMLGGMQFRALQRELVESGRMSERAFHDTILRGGTMPVEMVRARLMPDVELRPGYRAAWRFGEAAASGR